MINAALIKEYSEQICRIFSDGEILATSEFDLDYEGKYTNGFFVVGNDKICVFENGEIVLVDEIRKFAKFYCGEFTGSGVLEASNADCRKLILRFSMKYIESFNMISNILNDVINNSFSRIDNEFPKNEKICPKCGKPFAGTTDTCRQCTNDVSLIKKLLKLAKPYKKLYLCLFLLFWTSGLVTVISPFLSKHLINNVLISKNNNLTGSLLVIVGLMLLCTLITWLSHAIKDIVSSKASNYLVCDLRNYLYEKLQNMPLSYIEKKKPGDLMQRVNGDTHRIQIFIQDILIASINEIILFLAIAIITFYLNPFLALLIFLPMPLVIFLISKIRNSIKGRYMKQWRKMDILTNRLTEVLNGIKLVKVFGKEDEEIKKFKETTGTVRDVTCKNEKYVYTVFPLIRFLMSFGSYFVLLYGGSCVLDSSMSLGELVQFSSYGSYLYNKLEWFAMLPRHYTMAMVSSQRIFEVLDEVVQDDDIETITADNIKGKVDFENVSFGYKSYRKVLRKINTKTEDGEMIGLVGHSGAGKSTFINLVMRLYNPDSGRIYLDGKDIVKYNVTDYKNASGVVLQESYLFSGTIIDNIRYSNPEATIEECILAAKKANIHDFIMSLPDAYNTYVGEKGYKLSGGERQRVSIARAILSNPKILILDEATASVDTETEAKIQEALSNVIKGKTVFAIAHRLSTLKNANRLFVFEDGCIVESGTHSELIEKNGIYAKLVKAQQEMAINKLTVDGYEEPEKANEDFKEDVVYDKD